MGLTCLEFSVRGIILVRHDTGEGAMSKYSVPAGVPHAMGFEVTEKADILRVVFNATKTFN